MKLRKISKIPRGGGKLNEKSRGASRSAFCILVFLFASLALSAFAATSYPDVAWKWDASDRLADIKDSLTSAEAVSISPKSIYASIAASSRNVVATTIFSAESTPANVRLAPPGAVIVFF